jgi:predicted DNA-binding transcriptional regulator YafY
VRAARVLEMLLILQRRGRLTARELARQLDVSERTILRDVDAFSEAGVPIFTTRGGHGGIEVMDGFQTRLTGLTTDEAGSLFLIGQPEVAHRLGLGVPARATRNKLLNAIAPMLATEAEHLASWFLHDPDPPRGHQIPHGELRRLSGSIKRSRRVELFIGQGRVVSVRPLGLVLKAGSWSLVVMSKRGAEVLCIDELRATRLTNEPFVRPAGFRLNQFWRSRAGHRPGAGRRKMQDGGTSGQPRNSARS